MCIIFIISYYDDCGVPELALSPTPKILGTFVLSARVNFLFEWYGFCLDENRRKHHSHITRKRTIGVRTAWRARLHAISSTVPTHAMKITRLFYTVRRSDRNGRVKLISYQTLVATRRATFSTTAFQGEKSYLFQYTFWKRKKNHLRSRKKNRKGFDVRLATSSFHP